MNTSINKALFLPLVVWKGCTREKHRTLIKIPPDNALLSEIAKQKNPNSLKTTHLFEENSRNRHLYTAEGRFKKDHSFLVGQAIWLDGLKHSISTKGYGCGVTVYRKQWLMSQNVKMFSTTIHQKMTVRERCENNKNICSKTKIMLQMVRTKCIYKEHTIKKR